MVAKRRLSKSVEEQRDPGAKAISRAKKSKIDGRKPSPSAQEGEVEDNTVFVQLLKASGVILKSGNLPNELTLDQAVFQKKLFQGLRKHPHYPNVLQEFISGLESHIEDRDKFRNCLLACGLSQMGESSNAGTSYQESLIKLLLGIEVLQVRELIPRFHYPLIICGNSHFFFTFSAPEDGINMPRLIINQFKWLDRIVDSKEMTSKIMQLISVAPLEIQRDIITSLPEILEDAQHNEIGKELNLLLQQNTQLTVPILDALSSLNLRTELLAEVRQSVMSTLSAVNLEDLPVVIKFILHAITAADAVEVKPIELESCVLPPQLQPSQSQQTCRNPGGTSINQVKHDCVGIMFDVIKVSVRFQKTTAEAWIKVIELLVLIFCANYSFLFQVVREYFPTILSLAQTLLRSTDPSVVSFACEMYKLAFRTFDSYCQQEVVGALVTHVCSGFTAEADVSLDALLDLVSHILLLCPFYNLWITNNPCLCVQDDMHIVIRKQLSSTISKYKRIGIIGAVMMIGSLAYNRSKAEEASSNSATMSKESLRQATALLELVRGCSEHSPEAAALYYDELANLVIVSRTKLLTRVLLILVSKYVLPLMVMYNLDEEESEGGIVINLLPLLSEMGISPVCLASFFRLLRFCEEVQHNGNLEEIDALLGCPLYMTNDEMVEKLESLSKQERELLCSLQFHALNWFREVVNAFCKQQDPEMKGKVLLRLQNITQLQTSLEKCLAATPGYSPPLACFDCEVSDVTPFIAPAAPAKKGKKGEGQRIVEMYSTETVSCASQDNAEEGKVSINLSNYRAYFRELDISVFTILRCGLVTKSLLDTEQNTKVTEVVQLGSAELMFLLEDLSRKLEYILIATATRKINFLKVKADRDVGFSHLRQNTPLEMARFAVHLLDAFCNHLENIHNYFQVGVGYSNITWGSTVLWSLLCVCNVHSIYLEHTEDVLQSVEEIAGVGVPELLNSSKDGSSATFPTLTRQTFLIFYRVMMRELEKSVKCIPAGMPSDSSEVQAEKLLRWNLAVRDFHILVNLVKHGRFFLESFVKQGMPLLDYSFKKHRDDVQSLLKTLQLSTRQMHHMCGHTKINQDTSLTNHVPPMKRLLELFVYRVKAMLTINKCQEAFWLGNLKNRDLQGEEIQSQLSQQESERDEQSQVPEDDAEEVIIMSRGHLGIKQKWPSPKHKCFRCFLLLNF
uniref:FA complementation group D2 n=1 Tax=Callorhinchus milii TaxID=7868 RepID=A0A4W3K0T5_CALMI